ncbi:MAG: cell division protein [Fibrobacteres bacterium CG2_30_45_31]|nr:MAG: cell division protein [Fibrobacteres bacterium CG2_30_45_31]
MFGQLGYLISEAFRGWKQHRTVILPSFVTIFLCSLLLSASVVMLLGIFRVMEVEKSLYSVEVFLEAPLAKDSLESVRQKLERMKQVGEVTYISEEEALEDFRARFSNDMLSLVSGNPLPPSFRLQLAKRYSTPKDLHEIQNLLQRDGTFDAVQAPTEWVDRLASWKFSLIFWPICLSILLLFTLALIIGNSVRLSLFSRKLLVENMKYAGGSPFFIEFPFVLEGVMQGLLGSGLAALFLAFVFGTIRDFVPVIIEYISGYGWVLALIVLGVTSLSAYSSFRSVRGFLTHEETYN